MAAAMGGCDLGNPSHQPLDAPPVQLVEVRATTRIDDDGRPVRTSLDPDGSTEVLATASFVLKFDRFLLPSSAIRQSVCIQADVAKRVVTYEDCVAPVFLEPTYDPVRREVIYRQPPDQAPLRPGTRYVLTAMGPTDARSPAGFRAFDGAPLAENVRIEFSTRAEDPPSATAELPPRGDLFCQRDPECVAARCADDPVCLGCVNGAARALSTCAYGVGCHQASRDPEGAVVRGAAAGLDLDLGAQLSAVEHVRTAVIRRTARQTHTGEHAAERDRSPLRFGRAMPLIDAGNPGNSYLLYKILVGPNAVDPGASPSEAAQLAEEVERLRAAFVLGMPMPPPKAGPSFRFFSDDPEDPLLLAHVDGMDILTAWIASGAALRDCSAPP